MHHLPLFTRCGKTLKNITRKGTESTYTLFANCLERIFPMSFFYIISMYTSGPHFMATNIKSFRENWIRAPFFIYLLFLLFFSFSFSVSFARTPPFCVLHTLNNIREIRFAFSYIHSLTARYLYWCYAYHTVSWRCFVNAFPTQTDG